VHGSFAGDAADARRVLTYDPALVRVCNAFGYRECMKPAEPALPAVDDERFANTALAALRSTQAHLADAPGEHFVRYQPDVSPFVVISGDPAAALAELAGRMRPGEMEWLLDSTAEPVLPTADAELLAKALGIELGQPIGVGQMIFPADAVIGDAGDAAEQALDAEVMPMTGPDAGREMLELTRVAFPGFFRMRTNAMGPYFGIRRGGQLVAMGGDRMCFAPWYEVSGICTLPALRGQGLAAAIVRRVLREHRALGRRSYLHLATSNATARRIYDRLGFVYNREVFCTRVYKPQVDVV
jgi:GNAT superfamily N-acetyltransferase